MKFKLKEIKEKIIEDFDKLLVLIENFNNSIMVESIGNRVKSKTKTVSKLIESIESDIGYILIINKDITNLNKQKFLDLDFVKIIK